MNQTHCKKAIKYSSLKKYYTFYPDIALLRKYSAGNLVLGNFIPYFFYLRAGKVLTLPEVFILSFPMYMYAYIQLKTNVHFFTIKRPYPEVDEENNAIVGHEYYDTNLGSKVEQYKDYEPFEPKEDHQG